MGMYMRIIILCEHPLCPICDICLKLNYVTFALLTSLCFRIELVLVVCHVVVCVVPDILKDYGVLILSKQSEKNGKCGRKVGSREV